MSNPVDFNVVKLHPLMVETGFLTIKERISQGLYRCGLPNLSVEQEFDSVLSEYLMMTIGQEQANVLTAALSKYLKQGDIKQACVTINELLCSLRYDTFQHAHEAWYRTLLTIWLRAAADNANDVREETGNYQGRSDIELNISNRAYVFELKLIHNNSEQDNKRSDRSKYHLLETATKQILSKGYAVNSYTAGLPVTGVVLVISNKRRRIVAWRKLEATSDSCGRVSNVKHFPKAEASSTAA